MSGFAVFARMGMTINQVAREHRMKTVGFRTVPRVGDRTIRHRPDGSATVAVSVASRRDQHVAWDMAMGVAVVNGYRDWPAMLIAAFLAHEAMVGSIRERCEHDLRVGKVVDPSLLHI